MDLIKNFWEKWKAFGHKVGNFQARLILTIFYFVVISPFAAVVKYGARPLRLKLLRSSNWVPNEAKGEEIMVQARRQF